MNGFSLGHRMGLGSAVPLTLGGYGEAVLADDPVFFVRFDDGPDFSRTWDGFSGSEAPTWYNVGAKDSTGRHDPPVTYPYLSDKHGGRPPAINQGWSYGPGAYMVWPPHADFTHATTGELTIEIWGKVYVSPLDLPFSMAATAGITLYITDSTIRANVYDGSDPQPAVIAPNVGGAFASDWHHYAITVDLGNEFILYIDGEPVGSSPLAGAVTPGFGLACGQVTAPGGLYVDEFAVYPSVLSAPRIAAHYAAGIA